MKACGPSSAPRAGSSSRSTTPGIVVSSPWRTWWVWPTAVATPWQGGVVSSAADTLETNDVAGLCLIAEARAAAGDDLPVTVIERRRGWQVVNVRELWRYRELLYFLTWRDVKVRYKQTVLGAA